MTYDFFHSPRKLHHDWQQFIQLTLRPTASSSRAGQDTVACCWHYQKFFCWETSELQSFNATKSHHIAHISHLTSQSSHFPHIWNHTFHITHISSHIKHHLHHLHKTSLTPQHTSPTSQSHLTSLTSHITQFTSHLTTSHLTSHITHISVTSHITQLTSHLTTSLTSQSHNSHLNHITHLTSITSHISHHSHLNHISHLTSPNSYLTSHITHSHLTSHISSDHITSHLTCHITSHLSWQAQHLVLLGCHLTRQTQHVMKFWQIAGGRHVGFPYKMLLQRAKSNLGKQAGARWPVHSRIMLELSASLNDARFAPHTSRHNQPHYLQSITSPPPTHHGNTTSHHRNAATKRNGWRLVHTKHSRLGIALITGWSPCAHSIGRFFLWLIFFLSLKLPPPACPALLV